MEDGAGEGNRTQAEVFSEKTKPGQVAARDGQTPVKSNTLQEDAPIPPSKTMPSTGQPDTNAGHSASPTVSQQNSSQTQTQYPAALQRVMAAWDRLPEPVRNAIVALCGAF